MTLFDVFLFFQGGMIKTIHAEIAKAIENPQQPELSCVIHIINVALQITQYNYLKVTVCQF